MLSLRFIIGGVMIRVAASSGNGEATCKCLANGTAPLAAWQKTIDGKDCIEHVHSGSGAYCYPLDYGVGECKLWDEKLEPMCADSTGASKLTAPDHCTNSWCYVDKTKCLEIEDLEESAYFPGVYYSYETCGSESTFAKMSMAASKSAVELIDIIEDYSKDLRGKVENAYALASADETVLSSCSGWKSSCPCSSCTSNPSWTNQAKARGVQQTVETNYKAATYTLSKHLEGGNSVAVSKCVAQSVAGKYKSVVRREYSDKNRIAYLYYGDQKAGSFTGWPGLEWCPTNWDPRKRPWYAMAATGPKDVILLVDQSGSMDAQGLWVPAQKATNAVLDTLIEYDFATVIMYSSQAHSYDDLDEMIPMNEKNKKLIMQWVTDQSSQGGTNFRSGFQLAATAFENSRKSGKTSGCSRAILFLTDGKDDSGLVPSDIPRMGLEGVTILTYSFGSGADTRLPKMIACQNQGIWYHVMEGQPIENIMVQYFNLFAAGMVSDTVRWVKYEDAVTKEPLLAGCLPTYDRSGSVPELLGVSCMDINVIVSMDTLASKPKYAEMRAKQIATTKTCASLRMTAATLQHLRQQVSTYSVCKACDNDDTGCAAETYGGGPSTTSGASDVSNSRQQGPLFIMAIFSCLATQWVAA
jgi:hypothetical protein